MNTICEKHKVPYEDTDCGRCNGNGYTDSDIEDMDNPIEWADGNCFQCKGSGVLKDWSCPTCDEEYLMELEKEEREL